MTQRCERRTSYIRFFGLFAGLGAVAAIGLTSAGTRTILIAFVLTMHIPGVAIVLFSLWRSPADRRGLLGVLTDLYRVHPGTRLSGPLYAFGAVIAAAFVVAFVVNLPFLACYGAIRTAFYRALGRPLPYERAHDP